MKVFKPKTPFYFLGLALFFLLLSLMFFTSEYYDSMMGFGASILFSFSLFFIWLTDRVYMKIKIDKSSISFKGYFGIRNMNLKNSEIRGYQTKEVVDEFSGRHNQLRIKTVKGAKIVLPKVAYSNYSELQDTFSTKFKFLAFEPLKYAEFYQKTLPIIGAISAILYLIKSIIEIVK